MNLLYAEMIRWLPQTDPQGNPLAPEQAQRERDRLDALLQVESWSHLLPRSRPVQRPADGPWWWKGDEDASASFIESMGITFDD